MKSFLSGCLYISSGCFLPHSHSQIQQLNVPHLEQAHQLHAQVSVIDVVLQQSTGARLDVWGDVSFREGRGARAVLERNSEFEVQMNNTYCLRQWHAFFFELNDVN